MANILVLGGLFSEDENESLSIARNNFSYAIGKQIILGGHVLLGGCRTSLDDKVATGAESAAIKNSLNPKRVIKSWVTDDVEPSHRKGELIRSDLQDWGHVPKRFMYPEPFQEADIVIIIGGWNGTHYAASWARLANKPILPVASFGLAAQEIYQDELKNLDQRYKGSVSIDSFSKLNRYMDDSSQSTLEEYANEVVNLAEQFILNSNVFVIMSFAKDNYLIDAYDTFQRVCLGFGLRAYKVDECFESKKRIIPSIIDAIQQSDLIIADVSNEPGPNIYYELGFAHALGKKVIVTAFIDTKLPFDVFDTQVLFWESQNELAAKLNAAIEQFLDK